jgi:hypothetical protein
MRGMKLLLVFSAAAVLVVAAGCEDNPIRPSDELAPPTNLTMVDGTNSVTLTWDASPFEPSSRFKGYNVYVDTVSIAGVTDTTTSGFLEARQANDTPLTGRTFAVDHLHNGNALVQGKKYYFHVRTVREDDRVSIASNEVDTSPRPEGTNDTQPSTDTDLMFDYAATTTTKSGYGWDRIVGTGIAYTTAVINQDNVDFFMMEEPNSADDGSQFISPAQAAFTATTWTVKHRTLFKDLGAGDAAWNTAVAPDTASMTQVVKVNQDHTYALRLYDGHWAKIRALTLTKNVTVSGSSGNVQLNRLYFRWAFQLIDDYGRFKPVPDPGL